MPTWVPSVAAAVRVPTTRVEPLSHGSALSAVRVLRVLAGASLLCTLRAAKILPVVAAATMNAVAVVAGRAGTRAPGCTRVPRAASAEPPNTVVAADADGTRVPTLSATETATNSDARAMTRRGSERMT